MDKIKKKPDDGDIFVIPLYLPSYQKWRETFDEFIDYRKYKLCGDDIYAYGRIIEPYDNKSVYLVEIFRYAGRIPDSPEAIKNSGRMFKPMLAGGMFEPGRWRVLFEDPGYDKWRDSDYENISFLYLSDIWKGGEKIHITSGQYHELWESGDIPTPAIRGGVDIECDIRRMLAEQGMELNYEQTVEERRDGYPRPRDIDRKLKETIAPFRWMSQAGTYTLTLEADALNGECFAEAGMSGNGYDWEKLAFAYIEENIPELKKKLDFDCEADVFCVRSSAKRALREFALAFRRFCMDKPAFKSALMRRGG